MFQTPTGALKVQRRNKMLRKVAAVIVFSGLMSGVAFAAGSAGTGIAGSMHDMNAVAGMTGDSMGRSCAFCHTPHNAQATALAPLWNHQPSTVTLDPYVWKAPTNKGITFAGDPLVGPSRLCMACHDGIVAPDSHGTAGGAVGSTGMTSHYTDALNNNAKRFIDDLTVTHPIGFLYADAVTKRNTGADVPELITPDKGFINSPVTASFDTTLRDPSTSSKKIGDTLYNGYMTCASCHDVHNTVNAKPDAGHSYNYFLYAKQEGSAICLSCHVK
jgi:hypothetical protein